MKKFITLMLFCLLTTFVVPQEAVTIELEDLTTEQFQQIRAKKRNAPSSKPATVAQTASQYIGIGKEVGVAINEGLSATIDAANKFGNTKVGTFTMIIIAWKFLYLDLAKILLGILFASIVTMLLITLCRNLFPRKRRMKGVWWQFWVTKEYEMIEPKHGTDYPEWMAVMYLIILVGCYGITYAIMF